MATITKIRVGVPVVAPLLILSTLVWYRAVGLGIDQYASGAHVSDFWSYAFIFCPFISLAFAVLLVLTFISEGKKHPILFWLALLFGLSPLLLILPFVFGALTSAA
jgi:hypothetical protein